MAAPPSDLSRWWDRWRRRPPTPAQSPDVVVAAWKTAWLQGANAAWGPQRSHMNPYESGPQRSAWDAGWRWAGRNPDRRNHAAERIAHPHRRATDALTPSLK